MKTTHEREARWQRRRRLGLVAVVPILVVGAVAAGLVLVRWGGSHPARGTTESTASLVRTRFAVSVSSYARPRWSGLVLVDPAHRRCRNVPLPGAPSYITFSGDRYVYAPGPKTYWLGRIGGPLPRRIRNDTDGVPYWLDGRVGLAGVFSQQLQLGGRTLNLNVPRGAQVAGFVASRGRIAFQAWWGDVREGTGRTATFLYSHGAQRRVALPTLPRFAAYPTEYDLLGWTPSGRRLVVMFRSNIWTVLPDGTHPRPLTHLRPTGLSLSDTGSLLWSPDGRLLAFIGNQGDNSPPQTYIVRADGSRPVRPLTHTRRSSGPYGQQDGTVPLAWLSPNALAAAHQFWIGILRLDGSFRPLCRREGVTFGNGTALPRRSRAAQPS